MNVPADRQYTESHEWALITNDTASVGLTDYAQGELGDLVFVNLPEVGDEVVKGEPFADVESVKAVSEVYSPVSGTIVEINEVLLDEPGNINEAPYEAWLIKVDPVTESNGLMDADAYSAHCG